MLDLSLRIMVPTVSTDYTILLHQRSTTLLQYLSTFRNVSFYPLSLSLGMFVQMFPLVNVLLLEQLSNTYLFLRRFRKKKKKRNTVVITL